jgi:hypothetical protein
MPSGQYSITGSSDKYRIEIYPASGILVGMGEDVEEITIPNETQGLVTLRRAALTVFISVSVIVFGVALIVLIAR